MNDVNWYTLILFIIAHWKMALAMAIMVWLSIGLGVSLTICRMPHNSDVHGLEAVMIAILWPLALYERQVNWWWDYHVVATLAKWRYQRQLRAERRQK